MIHKPNHYQKEHVYYTRNTKIHTSKEESTYLKEEMTSKYNFKETTQDNLNESHLVTISNTQEHDHNHILVNEDYSIEETQELISQILAEYILAEEKTI